ncbi:transcription factor IIIB 50 kDa subunit isoform X2 [Sinocyclocheilus rhinocerous]|uniref:Transcription factor IIIB 50 kDa subunit n=1 Tax=Sinocyclocheilus rhinocerous TaxID=307959 RepID=A0A673L5M7_9TELE|nr:PREDICTED: transcription factor IIIB 50 kDa subunit-like isoform X1 [Sinocyclocheilus rhinocerous]XP_016415820.1 PREDICTED: transcription factor IIIB 50 kDa subunit-like isoform X2 [Sinocyclocheilus rhinocerous]
MPSSCPECGSSNVVEDDLYSQRQWVCVDCGSVVSEGHLTTTVSDETQGRAVPYHASTEVLKKPCRNLIAGFSRVRALCRILRLSSDMESAVVSLFERAYNHPNFIFVTLTKKEILGGCCVLSVCRQCNWPVAMGTIGYLLGVDNAALGTVYREFTKALNIEISTIGIMDMLESFCYDFKLGPQQVEEVFAEPPQRLVDRTSALIELAADVWIVTGRQPLPLLFAAVYLAWQSLNPTVRMKYTFIKFCKIGKAPEQSWHRSRDSVVKRLKELRDVLCKLGRELPWLRGGAVEPNTVVPLVDDILKNRRALLMRAVRNYEQQLQNESQTAQTTECDNELSDSNRSNSHSSKTPELMDPDQAGCENPPDKEATDCQLPPNHWSKKHLFLPPCVKSRKRRRVDAPQLEVTGDEEISDSEIESYIRSQDEIEMYLKVRKELKNKA